MPHSRLLAAGFKVADIDDRYERAQPQRSKIGGCSRSGYLAIATPADSNVNRFSQPRKDPELLLPDGIRLRWSGWIAKDQRRRLDEERLVGFNQSADLSYLTQKDFPQN
jgi:hypothetical protein